MTITFESRYYPGFTITATSTDEISHDQRVWDLRIANGFRNDAVYDKVFLDDVIHEIML